MIEPNRMTETNRDSSTEESQQNASARRVKGEFVRGISGFRNSPLNPVV